jgi:soluble lytic murein transglycosylase
VVAHPPSQQWADRFDFLGGETRNYVERAMENVQIYRARLESNPKLLIEADLRRGG